MVWHGQRAFLAAAIIAVLTACSGDAESSASTTSESSTTINSHTTTSAPTTTTTEPTTTTTSVEDAVRDVHTRVMTEMFAVDELAVGHEALPAAARDLTTGPLLRRLEESAVTSKEAGEFFVGPGYTSNIISIEIDGDHAAVVDCSQDLGEIRNADGDVVVPADDFFKLRQTNLVLIDGRWLVEELYAGGDERCDPEDVQ